MVRAIVSSPVNILLLVAPVSWLLAYGSPGSPWVFMTAAISLIPLAGLIGLGGILAMTSRYKETSPVLRGAWALYQYVYEDHADWRGEDMAPDLTPR